MARVKHERGTYWFCLCSSRLPSETSSCKKEGKKEITTTAGQAATQKASLRSPSYLPAENIGQSGSAFALVFVLCETEELSAFASELERRFLTSWPTFRRNKYLIDEIGRKRSHFAVLHAHPPSIFNLSRKERGSKNTPAANQENPEPIHQTEAGRERGLAGRARRRYLSDDLYDFPNAQLQLVVVHGLVGKYHLTFPHCWHFFNCKHTSRQGIGGEHVWDTSCSPQLPLSETYQFS